MDRRAEMPYIVHVFNTIQNDCSSLRAVDRWFAFGGTILRIQQLKEESKQIVLIIGHH